MVGKVLTDTEEIDAGNALYFLREKDMDEDPNENLGKVKNDKDPIDRGWKDTDKKSNDKGGKVTNKDLM